MTDERDDLGEVWGQQDQQSYEQAQAFNVDAIASFMMPRGRAKPVEPPPPAPCVWLYKWHRQNQDLYMREKLRDYGDEPDEEDEALLEPQSPVSVEDEYEPRTTSLALADQQTDSEVEAEIQGQKRRRRDSPDRGEPIEHERRKRACSNGHYECFLCAWGDKFHDGIEAPKVNTLMRIIKQNYGVHDNVEIAQQLHLYFRAEIYDPDSGMAMLTMAVALEHIEGLHSLDAAMFLGESIRDEKRIAFLLKNMIFRQDGTYNEKALADYRRSVFNTRQLYNMRLQNMNFANGNTREDLRPQANYFNLQQPFTQRAERQKRQERVQKTRNLPAFKL